MAFAISIIKLEEAIKKDGCPICRRGHESGIRWIESLLWEYINDSGTRERFYKSIGLCNQHTRMLAAVEMSSSGPVLGVCMLYRGLSQKISQELQTIQKPGKDLSFWQELINEFKPAQPLLPAAKLPCPACEAAEKAEESALHAFFEALDQQDDAFMKIYRSYTGICLRHLRLGLLRHREDFPYAASYLVEHTIQFLEEQQELISAYLTKNDYAHLSEPYTEAEQSAWRKVLSFFTGYPAGKFDHHVEQF